MAKSVPRYLLDTNILRALADGDPTIDARIDSLGDGVVVVSVVAIREVWKGVLATVTQEESKPSGRLAYAYEYLQDSFHALCDLTPYPYSEEAETLFQSFPAKVKRVGTNDCRIAASAITSGLTVLTRDKDFAAIPGVSVERW